MKKFSWIFALILALSLAFIGCPAGDDDNGGGGSGGGINFGAGDGQIEVFGPGDVAKGRLEYITGGYKYTYGTAGYSGGIVRFKIDFGDDVKRYAGVSFKWKATGYADNDSIANNKQIFLLSTVDEEAIKNPGKTTAGYLTDAEIKSIVVNITDFVDHPEYNFYKNNEGIGPNSVFLTGNAEKTVTMPIAIGGEYAGEVWFSIYAHAVKDSYTITDFKFLDTYDGPPQGIVDGDNTPTTDVRPPPELGNDVVNIDVAITRTASGGGIEVNMEQGSEWTAGANDNPTASIDDGVVTLNFTGTARQRVNFILSNEQIEAIINRNTHAFEITMVAEFVSGSDSWRYAVTKHDAGSNWATSTLTSGTIAQLSNNYVTFPSQNETPTAFTIQFMGSAATVIKITSIHIQSVPKFFVDAVADKTITTTTYGSGTHSYNATTGVITVKGNGGFAIPLPADINVDENGLSADVIVITYACYAANTEPVGFYKKQKDGWTDLTPPDYNAFVEGTAEATLEIDLAGFSADGIDVGKAFFQTKTNPAEAKIKIISVAIKE